MDPASSLRFPQRGSRASLNTHGWYSEIKFVYSASHGGLLTREDTPIGPKQHVFQRLEEILESRAATNCLSLV